MKLRLMVPDYKEAKRVGVKSWREAKTKNIANYISRYYTKNDWLRKFRAEFRGDNAKEGVVFLYIIPNDFEGYK